ncbi:uncharacterized protein CDAR_220821 [Caerostris darwini]|uniref:Uncharacterized protein n=1 Tax=Caerostris darwini TaxID=1538125 RepID=A0AAV4PEG3_9ARAC|nr:uncharacterized protein CDAR_220821 [Caerostris darwini]
MLRQSSFHNLPQLDDKKKIIVKPLRDICLHNVAVYLRRGTWKKPNTSFQYLPVSLVDDLLHTVVQLQSSNNFRPDDMQILFETGRVERFTLRKLCLFDEIVASLHTLMQFCQRLKFLEITEIMWFEMSDFTPHLEEMLKACPSLEDLHSSIRFDLTVLRKCPKLRSVRMHFKPKQPWSDILDVDDGVMQSRECLKVLSCCKNSTIKAASDDIEILMRHCPLLLSLGNVETSKPLAHIYRTVTLNSVLSLVLPRALVRRILPNQSLLLYCNWVETDTFFVSGWSLIRDAIRQAPLLEELRIEVRTGRSIPFLKSLGKLRLLDLVQKNCEVGIGPELIDLMEGIGHQLRHLSLDTDSEMDISAVLHSCPHLESLRLLKMKGLRMGDEPIRLPRLKHFSYGNDRRLYDTGLLLMLSGCSSLKEMFLGNVHGLDDELLYSFTRKNLPNNLKVLAIQNCSLTKEGLRRFLQNVPNLEEFSCRSIFFKTSVAERILRITNPNATFYDTFELFEMQQFFNIKRSGCRKPDYSFPEF